MIVLDDGTVLPEGTAGVVLTPAGAGQRVRLPLIRTGRPGSVALTNERIAEILDDEEVEHFRGLLGGAEG